MVIVAAAPKVQQLANPLDLRRASTESFAESFDRSSDHKGETKHKPRQGQGQGQAPPEYSLSDTRYDLTGTASTHTLHYRRISNTLWLPLAAILLLLLLLVLPPPSCHSHTALARYALIGMTDVNTHTLRVRC